MCDMGDPFAPVTRDPVRQMCWMRANGKLGDDPNLHLAVAAYASDHRLLTTPLLGHGMSNFNSGVKLMASLDHSMWFHAPFRCAGKCWKEVWLTRCGGDGRADDWLLYEFDVRFRGENGVEMLGKVGFMLIYWVHICSILSRSLTGFDIL